MPPRRGLSKGELEVVRLVWGLPNASVRQVHEALPRGRNIDFTTVQTVLRRLEGKRYLNVRMEGRTRVYSPRVKPRTVVREIVDDLVERLFAGEVMPLVRHLVEERNFSATDIVQLRQLIQRIEEDSHAD